MNSNQYNIRQPSNHPQLPKGSPLQACPRCDALVDITEREPLEDVECPGCAQHFAVTSLIDQYQVVEVAGRGGMGVVYKAYDPGLDRLIALKLLRKSHSGDEKLIQQLETEAAVTASINDANVVRVYGTGRDRGRFFLAMELADKGSLEDLIRLQGRVAEAQVLEIGIQVASGLRAAWQAGMIHRDVKPGNILFADANTPKIVDFGLAIFMEQQESGCAEIWGTPYYVAPEKFEQEPEDFRSDMYSLGASLFHALAGRPPFEAESASLVALKHLKSQAAGLQSFAPWVSNATAHIINRSLLKNPAHRYQSYDELIHNLEYALHQLRNPDVSHSRARVVLETDADKKTMTWVVLGMAVAIIGLVIALIVARPKTPPTQPVAAISTQPEAPGDSAKQSSGLVPIIDVIAWRDSSSVKRIEEVIKGEKLTPAELAWAQMLLGVANLSQGKGVEARNAFGRVTEATPKMKDEREARFLASTAAKLAKTESAAGRVDAGAPAYEGFALFAYGLQNYNAGRFEEGTALLRQFRNVQLDDEHAWLKPLQQSVISYIEEIARFDQLNARLRDARNTRERVDAALELRRMTGFPAAKVAAAIAPYAREIEEFAAAANRPPTPGLYRIVNRRSGRILDVAGYSEDSGGRVAQWSNHFQSNECWEVLQLSSGTYAFRPLHALTQLDVSNSNQDEGGVVYMWGKNDSPAQQWLIQPAGEGYFKIRSKVSNKLLTVKDKSTSDQTEVEQRSDSDDPSQLWRFESIGETLPDGWFAVNVGSDEAANKVEEKGGTYMVTNQGSDIWESKDAMTMVARSHAGDFDLVVQVLEVENVVQWTKAGLSVRASFAPEQANVSVLTTPIRVTLHQRRLSGNADSTCEQRTDIGAPVWLKLERRGNRVTSFYSLDANSWTQIASDDMPNLGREPVLGIVLSSHDANLKSTAKFDHLKFTAR
jgi:serine/threonine protein kinase